MRKIVTRIAGAFMLLIVGSSAMHAQMAGTYSVPGTFTSLAAAINSLNSVGVGTGGATINIAAAYTETAPVGGYSITATGTATNPIVFQKSGTGANPLITAYATGTAIPTTAIQNGVFMLVGSDYVTFDGIDIIDPNTANPATMEYGYGLFAANNTTDGCQYNTIKNCTITLNRVNNAIGTGASTPGSRGIVVACVTYTTQTTILTSLTATTGANSYNKFYGNLIQNCNIGISMYGANAPAYYDTNNDIGGTSAATSNTIVNYGGGAVSSAAYGIYTMYQQNLNVSNNTINNNNGSGVNHGTTLYGISIGAATGANSSIKSNTLTVSGGGTGLTSYVIYNNSGSAVANTTVDISNNVIANCNNTVVTTGTFYGINNAASAANVNINNNTFTNNIVGGAATTGAFVGINNGGSPANLNINNNTFTNTSTKATTGIVYNIYQNGSPSASISIQNNEITWTHNGATAHSGAFWGIYNTASGTTSTLNVSGNDFSNITRSVTSTGGNLMFINLLGTQSVRFVNGNTFTNLLTNHGGAEYLIYNQGTVTNTLTVNNNSIIGTFSRGGATSNLLNCINNSVATSTAGVREIANNVFSNITATLAGAGSFNAIYDLNSGASTAPGGKLLIHDNLVSNVDIATSAPASNVFYGVYASGSIGSDGTDASAVYSNTVTNINYQGIMYGCSVIPGISDPTRSNVIYSNEVSNVNSAHAIYGIFFNPGANSATAHLKAYKNKLANLTCTATAGQVFGMYMTSNYYADVYNNMIGLLYSNYSSGTAPSIAGIFINSGNANLWHNTVYLDAGSPSSTSALTITATHFASAAAYVNIANTLDLRNNILINKSVHLGTGKTTSLWRSGFSLTTFSTSSNNNLYYAGVPSASNVIYHDGSVWYPSLSTYQVVFAPRDSSSMIESSTPFLSTVYTATNYLHIDPTQYTLAKSNAVSIPGLTDDYDAEIRQGNAGYTGGASAPDIGADEFNLCLPPAPPVSTSALSNYVVCGSNGVTALSASGTGTVNWYNVPAGGSPLGTGTSFTTPVLTSNTIFYAQVTNSSSCSSNRTAFNVVLLPKPTVSIMSPTSTICEGTSLSLIASGDAVTYTWSQAGGNSNAIVISPSVTTTYTVVGSAPYGCTNTASQQIMVNPSPTLTASAQPSMICLGEEGKLNASGAQSYIWASSTMLGNGSVLQIKPNITTSYTVTGTNANGCSSSAVVQQKVNSCTGINENASGNLQLSIYPNPTSGVFTIALNNGLDKTFELFDLTGRVVMTNISSDNTITININQFSNGVYYLRVKSNNTVEVVKIVKQ